MTLLSEKAGSSVPSDCRDTLVVGFFSSPSCSECKDLKEPKMLDGLDFCRLRGRDFVRRPVFELVLSRFEVVEPLGDGGAGVKDESVLRFLKSRPGALSGGSWGLRSGVNPVKVGLKMLKLLRRRRSLIVMFLGAMPRCGS